MATLSKGSFSLNLGIVQIGGDLSEDDRQCAWELYTELSTRVAVTGKLGDPECDDFSGELIVESFDSLYAFFQEARRIMRQFPVGRLETEVQDHLGLMISRVLSDVLRPFMEKWQTGYRYWWEHRSNPRIEPIERQHSFPQIAELLEDWKSVRWLMRKLQEKLVSTYSLVNIHQHEQPRAD